MLRRMGAHADTQAYNEVLHLLRLSGDFGAAEALWRRMAEADVERDALSFYHLLHICGELGRWRDALALLDEMQSRLGTDAAHSGHYLAAMRACVGPIQPEPAAACRHAPPGAAGGHRLRGWLPCTAVGSHRVV